MLEGARKIDPSISEDVKLYLINSKEVNTFAIGKKTVCITDEMLKAPKEQIKAALAHEIGHIAHKDTISISIFSVGNIILIFILIAHFIHSNIISKVYDFLYMCGGKNKGEALAAKVSSWIVDFLIFIFAFIWILIGILLFRRSSRKNEFKADEFAFKLGCGNDLCELLDSSKEPSKSGFFAIFSKKHLIKNIANLGFISNLINGHLDKNERIAALIDLGATYRNSYDDISQKFTKSRS